MSSPTLAPNTPVIPLVDGAFILDNTTLELGTTCPTAFFYYKFLRRERSAERAALAFGGIIHEALEVRYRAAQQGRTIIDDTLLAEMVEKVRLGYEKWSPADGEWRTYNIAVAAIAKYAEVYPIEGAKVVAVERPFLKPLGVVVIQNCWVRNETFNPDGTSKFETTYVTYREIPVLWSGRLDVILERENGLYLRDHKTTSMMGPTYSKEFELSSQFLGYSWAIQEEIGQAPVGYEINGLGIRKPTRTGVPFEYQRFYYPVSREAISEWVVDTLTIISTLLSYASIEHFPRHLKHCQGKYGECQYKIACSLAPAHRNLMLNTGEYREVTWSPLNDR